MSADQAVKGVGLHISSDVDRSVMSSSLGIYEIWELIGATICRGNKFNVEEPQQIPVFKVNDLIRNKQIDKLNKLRLERSTPTVECCLEKIKQAAINEKNLMPPVIEAVENSCTLGEIADVLRKVFGEFAQ